MIDRIVRGEERALAELYERFAARAFGVARRVLRSDGTVAMAGDPERGPLQIAALRDEGVILEEGRVDMSRFGWLPAVGR